MWLNELKIAIIEQNIDKLNELMGTLPELTQQEDIEMALSLISEATILVTGLRDDTYASMIQMQKNINFLKSTQVDAKSKLDITS